MTALTKHPLYGRWRGVINRCENPNQPNYQNYGARGITICPQWRRSFLLFVLDMGDPPTLTHQLDRINNDGPYEPSNCRWATPSQQRSNQRPRGER